MAGYLGTYLAMAYSVVGICSYIVLRMFYGVLQARKTVLLLFLFFFFFFFRVMAVVMVLLIRGENSITGGHSKWDLRYPQKLICLRIFTINNSIFVLFTMGPRNGRMMIYVLIQILIVITTFRHEKGLYGGACEREGTGTTIPPYIVYEKHREYTILCI